MFLGLMGGIGCWICQSKNRPGYEGFIICALLGPIGLIIVLCLSRQSPDKAGRHWTDAAPAVLPPAGWYPHPAGGERYWSGSEWSLGVPPRLGGGK